MYLETVEWKNALYVFLGAAADLKIVVKKCNDFHGS